MEWIYIVCISIFALTLLIGIVVAVIKAKKQKILLCFNTGYGKVNAVGKRKEYVISVEGKYEFLVQNGIIVSSRNKEHESQIIQYTGGANV